MKFSQSLLDCELTPTGLNQCKKAREACNNLNVKTVYVSPLKRAL